MALTYEETSGLMADTVFISRVKVACLKYATYISDEAATTPAHSTRVKWSQATMANPQGAAMQITPIVVMDAGVQADGAAITDAALQSSVEASLNKML